MSEKEPAPRSAIECFIGAPAIVSGGDDGTRGNSAALGWMMGICSGSLDANPEGPVQDPAVAARGSRSNVADHTIVRKWIIDSGCGHDLVATTLGSRVVATK